MMIRSGVSPMMLAGGADAPVSRGILTAFEKKRVVSTRRWDDPRQASRLFHVLDAGLQPAGCCGPAVGLAAAGSSVSSRIGATALPSIAGCPAWSLTKRRPYLE